MEPLLILAVDDRPDNLYVLQQLVEEYLPQCRLLTAASAEQGLAIAAENRLSGALIDVQMPGLDGVEMCRRLKEDPKTEVVPVILMTAHRTATQKRVAGLEAGADDFISKPIDNIELIAKIKVMLRIKRAEDILRREKYFLEDTVRLKNRQLGEVEKRYQTLFNAAADPIIMHGLDGRILEVNDSACQSLGYCREEMLDLHIHDIVPAENGQEFSRQMAMIHHRGAKCFETAHLSRDGTIIPVEYSCRLVDYQGARAVLSIVRDITQRKELEGQKRQVQKMEAIATLAGGISHDFNNILTMIIGYLDLALMDIVYDPELKFKLEKVLHSANRAKNLVKQILTFSRHGGPEKQAVAAKIIVKDYLERNRAKLPDTIYLDQEITSSGLIKANPDQIRQVLKNLCQNAVRAMSHHGGRLKVTLTDLDLATPLKARFGDLEPGPYIRLTVADTGPGIKPEILGNIFDPYFTTWQQTEGAGLGLSVVQGIVLGHDGQIIVETGPENGTVFSIYLPRLPAPPLAREKERDRTSRSCGESH